MPSINSPGVLYQARCFLLHLEILSFYSKFNTSSPGKVTAVELLTNPYFNQTESGFRNDLNTLPPGHWNDTENDFSFSLGSAQFTGELPSFDSLFDTNHSIQHNKVPPHTNLGPLSLVNICLLFQSLMETKFIEDSAAVLDCVLSEEDEVEEDVCESIKTTDPSPYEMQISDASDMEILPKRKRKQREIHRSPSPGLDLLKSLNQTLKQKKKTKTRKLNKLETERSSDAIQGQRTNQQTPVFAQDSIKPTPVDPFAFNEACSLDSAKQNPPKLPPNSTMDLAPVKQLESRLDYTRSRSYGLNVPVINSNFTEVKTAKQLQQETYESPTPRAHSESLHLEISSASESGDSISDNSVTFQCQNSIHVQKRSTDKSVEDVTLNRINTLQEKSSLSINLEIESCTSEELSIEILQSSPRRNSPPVLTAQQDDEFSISEASSLRADYPGPSLPPVPFNELQGLLLQMRTLLRSHFQSTGDALSLQELHQLVNGVSGSNTVSIKRLFFAVLHLARTPDVQVTFHGTSNQRHLSLSLYDTNDEPNFEFNEFIFEETDNRTC
eukprot:g8416.t1